MKKYFTLLLAGLLSFGQAYAIKIKDDSTNSSKEREITTSAGDLYSKSGKSGEWKLSYKSVPSGRVDWTMVVKVTAERKDFEKYATLSFETKDAIIAELTLVDDVTIDDMNEKFEQTLRYKVTVDQINALRKATLVYVVVQTTTEKLKYKISSDFVKDINTAYVLIKNRVEGVKN